MVFSTLLTASAAETEYDFGLKCVGHVSSGMRAPFFPGFRYTSSVIGSAFSIAIISFVIHIALAKLISKKLSYPIDPNQVSYLESKHSKIIIIKGMACIGLDEYHFGLLRLLLRRLFVEPNDDPSPFRN